jgi:hypothetical protein
MDRRLDELCGQGECGSDIRTILNSEFRLDWKLQSYRRRVLSRGLEWPFTPRAGRAKGCEYLPEEQRSICYQDPAYEARNRMAKAVICRECFAILHGELGKHLPRIHPEASNSAKYRRRNPGAPLFSWHAIATKENSGCEDVMREVAERYATPEERSAAAADPEYEEKESIREYVICREERCGLKAASLCSHIPRAHDKSAKVYRREHDWPAVTCAAALEDRRNDRRARRSGAEELLSPGSKAFWSRVQATQERLEGATRAAQGSDERLARAIDEVLPKFARLFALSEVKANPKILMRHGCKLPDYSLDMITAAGGAVENSRRPKHWPKYAAISFVATAGNRERKSVQRAYDRFHAS